MTDPSLFTTVKCPVCACPRYKVILPSRYPANITRTELAEAYSASSNHELRDQMVECLDCAMQYLNPRPNDEIIVSSYAETEDPVFVEQNPERIRTFSRVLASLVRRFNWNPASQTLLDVGCAGGAFPKAAHDAGMRVTGIEPSHWLSRYGREKYGIDIRQGLLLPGVFDPESFDVVTLWDVIEHLTDPGGVLDTIREILKPGGFLLVNYPDIGSVAARLLGRKWPFLLGVHLLYYTRETMTRQLRDRGFEILHVQAHWQSLRFGYILRRIVPYFAPVRHAEAAVEAIGLGGLPVRYNMGQTLMVARKSAKSPLTGGPGDGR